jgi:tRNA threonylcarbamoyladenosine biosynthesis protein TsaB
MLLAIDTSTSWSELAVMDGFELHTGKGWLAGQQHSVQIFSALEALLRDAGISRNEITAIAVATGPGSFNGVRVAVTVAKTLAFVLGIPLVGMPTLTGIAQAEVITDGIWRPLVQEGGAVLAVLEAGRDELYTCWYDLHVQSISYPKATLPESQLLPAAIQRDAAFVRPTSEMAIANVTDIAALAPAGPVLLCGEASAAHEAALRELLGARLQVALHPFETLNGRAVGLGWQAQLRLTAGDTNDPMTLEPTYVRRPNITTSKRHPMLPPNG